MSGRNEIIQQLRQKWTWLRFSIDCYSDPFRSSQLLDKDVGNGEIRTNLIEQCDSIGLRITEASLF